MTTDAAKLAGREAAARYRERVGRDELNRRAALYRERNREKTRAAARAHREAHPERVAAAKKKLQERSDHQAKRLAWERKYRLRVVFGISPEDYEERLAAQGGGCAICGATAGNSKGHRLAVDHNHETGAVRGILCKLCNSAIGMLGDTSSRLQLAADYLRRYGD